MNGLKLTPDRPNAKLDGRYCINETCAMLGMTRQTLLKYSDSGEIRYRLRQNGKKKFYLGSEIIKFWERNT
jgi:predicted site-specific integrase-resolvase